MKHAFGNIKGSYAILSYDDYIVFSGPELLIFKRDGNFIAACRDLGYVRKCIRVSANTILVDYSSKNFYSLISLIDGSEVWRITQPKLDYTCSRFAISSDKRYVYDRFDLRGKHYYVRIDLATKELLKYQIQHQMRCVSDMVCIQTGHPVFLESHYEENENISTEGISINGVICHSEKEWNQLFRWQFIYPQIARFFIRDADTILTQDLCIYKPSNGEMYSLIEDNESWGNPGNSPPDYYLHDEQYLVLIYDTVNVIVDLIKRKMCARYVADHRIGSIVGNEYWVCTDEGIVKKPFPAIENIPIKKYNFWSPWN